MKTKCSIADPGNLRGEADMSGFIKHLSEIGRNDIDEVGGKGANLGELVRKGFPIPPGFVVSAEAYAHVFRAIKRSYEFDNFQDIPFDDHERYCSTRLHNNFVREYNFMQIGAFANRNPIRH
jgi:hypothetical protein